MNVGHSNFRDILKLDLTDNDAEEIVNSISQAYKLGPMRNSCDDISDRIVTVLEISQTPPDFVTSAERHNFISCAIQGRKNNVFRDAQEDSYFYRKNQFVNHVYDEANKNPFDRLCVWSG
ncbi:hypothetical protein LSAT2_003394 [Lamellibrachia satsuma]|nr:hypothetical protein LSAT2_003394 [Lamellibrachia satsuma]